MCFITLTEITWPTFKDQEHVIQVLKNLYPTCFVVSLL